ncbi:MAG: toxin-antitoxin system YwqK family antitoxin [Crocinitomicaceae bacterium]
MILRISILTLLIGLASCNAEDTVENAPQTESTESVTAEQETQNTIIEERTELIEVKENIYREYYPGKRKVKFEGPQDEEGKRHGKWQYFSKDGLELSMTMYDHGDKHGFSIVKYPNGNLHYHGEYKHNELVGVWKTYAIDGKLTNEVNYDELK